MTSVTLSLDEINELIKHFALQIQDRIDQLQKKKGLFLMYNDHTLGDEVNPTVSHILSKYSEYSSSETLEVKIIKKFTERLLQIFQFFKQKYISHSQNLLTVIENKIKQRLDSFVNMEIIPIGEVLQFAHFLTTKNSLTTILKYSTFKKQQKESKKKRNYLNSCSTSMKINLCSQPDEQLIVTEVNERKRQNQTQLSKLQVTKNQLNFERIKDRIIFHQPEALIEPQKRPFTGKQNRVRYKRSDSSSKQIKNWRKHSITANKKQDGYLKIVYKDKENWIPTQQHIKKPVQIDKLYVSMSLDKRYIEKMLQKKQSLLKDMQKRNEKIFNKMKKQQKKQKLEPQANQSKQKDQRKFIKQQLQEKSSSYIKLLTDHNVNIVSSGINKKQSFRNMMYQNHLEKKKKCFDKQSVYKKSLSKYEVLNIQDKENMFIGM